MDKIKLPKLHLVCATDELRPVMQHILITKDEIVASDAHILAVLKTSDIFSDAFIAAMPERFLIHKSQWKAFYNGSFNITFENNLIWVYYDGYKICYEIKLEEDGLKYPNYNAIFPKEEELNALSLIGINPFLLKKLAEGMLMPWQVNKTLKFKFYGEHKAILVRPVDIDINSKGVIMPCVVTD